MQHLIKQHGKKVAGTAATGGAGGIMVWALMTFTPISDHTRTRAELQALREATGPVCWDYEKNRLFCTCMTARTNLP